MQGGSTTGHLQHDVDAVAVRLGAQPADDVVARRPAPGRRPSAVAIASRSGLMSVAKTPARRPSSGRAIAIRPIGPQPVTTAVWPATSSTNAAWTGVAQRLLERGDLGRVALVDPGVRLRQRPRTRRRRRARGRPGCACSGRRGPGRCGTGSRSSRRCASRPRPCRPAGCGRRPGRVPTTTPAISWPNVIGGGPKFSCAHGSQRSMWTSVPHTLAAWTRTRISPGPG